MLSVRGMGVAVSVSTSTLRRICLMRSLCATPKRCSSSTTSSPRSRNTTSFDSSRWVPTRMSSCAARHLREDGGLFGLGSKARHHVHTHGKRREARAQRLEMLEGQHRRGRQNGHLLAVHHGLERRAQRHFRLAVADIAAQQAVHGRRRLHVALDVGHGRDLIGRERRYGNASSNSCCQCVSAANAWPGTALRAA